jgi:SAM-dependent methyltransferase
MKEYYNQRYAKTQLDLDEKGNTFEKIRDVWQENKMPMRVLDIGCGAGSVSGELVRRGHLVHGLDVLEEAVCRAKRRGIQAEVYDLNRLPLPFEENHFDCVLALDILEHLYDPLGLLRDLYRLLAPDGFAIVFLPLHFDIRQRLRILTGKGILLYEHLLYDPNCKPWEYFHIRFFTLGEAQDLLRIARFRIDAQVFRPMVISDLHVYEKPFRIGRILKYLTSRHPALFASGVKMVVSKLDSSEKT